MNILRHTLIFFCVLTVNAQTLSTKTLANLTYDQHLGVKLDLTLPFTDEHGHSVTLGQYFNGRPVILDLGYYKCPMLCDLALNGLLESLENLRPSVGTDFNIVFVSISPSETPALAAAKRETYIRAYDRPGSEIGWHFLTGRQPAIAKLARTVGFNYIRDPASGQYAHPAGMVIVTPEGQISRYFLGVNFSSSEMDAALKAAAARRVGSPVHELFLLCCSFVPLIGKYSAQIMLAVRIASVAVLAALVTCVIRGFCFKPSDSSKKAPEQNQEVRR